MSSIHSVNVGGSTYLISDSSNMAPLEPSMFASRAYSKGRLMLLSDGLLYRANDDIASGEALVINGNLSKVNIDEIIAELDTDSDLIAPTENGTTASDNYSIGDQINRSGVLYLVIDDITSGDTFIIGNNIELAGSISSQIHDLTNKVADKVLVYTNVACSATTGDFVNASGVVGGNDFTKVTANHEPIGGIDEIFSKPSAITSDIQISTGNGTITINGTCTDATCTATIVLIKKDNT